jgi:hypothetical protein
MVIPEQLRKTVAFICYRNKEGKTVFAGTCFFFGLQHEKLPDGQYFVYTITAKHIIVGIKDRSVDSKVIIRVNLKSGGYENYESNVDDWFDDPQDPTDVSILNWGPSTEKCDVQAIASNLIPKDEIEQFKKPSVGDDVAIIGLFINYIGKKKNIPIVRSGTIAALPEEKVSTQYFGDISAYLIESRSIGGLSSSPVFAHLTDPRINEDGTAKFIKMRFIWLLGLIHGHYDISEINRDDIINDLNKSEMINMGIAIVTPANKILQALNHPKFLLLREKWLKEKGIKM